MICTGAIRDTLVWPNEAAILGQDPPEVISYHQLAKRTVASLKGYGPVIFDESHWLKTRDKTIWAKNAILVAKYSDRVLLASGTPTPNGGHEIWAQRRLLIPKDDISAAFWRWAERHFYVTPSRHGSEHSKDVSDRLQGCYCPESQMEQCPHWREFARSIGMDEWMLRRLRDDVWSGMPPMMGVQQPLWCPMTAEQRRVYTEIKKQFFAEMPDDGMIEEAMNSSDKYSMMYQASTGLSTMAPDADDRHSGKLATFAEGLDARGRGEHTLVGVHFHTTAAAVMRVCDRLKLTYTTFSGRTSANDRERNVRQFQEGRYNVMIGSIAAIAEGITLTRADQAHMLERPTSPGGMEQVIRRIHRIGQNRPVTVRQYVTPKSPDEVRWDRLWRRDRRTRAFYSVAELRKAL